MSFLIEKYKKIKAQLDPQGITIVAVSKTKSEADIMEAYGAGVREFGENYVQELTDKYQSLPKNIKWHFIGHLQTNKVKYIAPFIHLIHGVDTEKLLQEIDKQGSKLNRTIPCLLQVHISKEETKFGFDENELKDIIQKLTSEPKTYKNVDLKGLMGMATFTEDNDLIMSEFKRLKVLFQKFKTSLQSTENTFDTLSMGMSADFIFAADAGSTMVRIGSLLFGERK